jgi:hypothetical protein
MQRESLGKMECVPEMGMAGGTGAEARLVFGLNAALKRRSSTLRLSYRLRPLFRLESLFALISPMAGGACKLGRLFGATHQAYGNGQVPGSGQVAFGGDLLLRFFVAEDGVVNGAVEELAQELVQFEFSVKFDDVVGEGFAAEEVPEIVAGEAEGPDELVEADAFSGAAGCRWRGIGGRCRARSSAIAIRPDGDRLRRLPVAVPREGCCGSRKCDRSCGFPGSSLESATRSESR